MASITKIFRQPQLLSLTARKRVLRELRTQLRRKFRSRIVSALVYGSTLGEDFSLSSDFDVLIVTKNPNTKLLQELKDLKSDWLQKGVLIDFNVHKESDLPFNRKAVFWHNNRAEYLKKELELYGVAIIGKNPFIDIQLDPEELYKEAVRVINSLNYQARKLYINSELKNKDRILFIKWCIYGALYALASRGIFPPDRKIAMRRFRQIFKPKISPEKFLRIKLRNPEEITNKDLNIAYSFLSYLDKRIFTDYQRYVQK